MYAILSISSETFKTILLVFMWGERDLLTVDDYHVLGEITSQCLFLKEEINFKYFRNTT